MWNAMNPKITVEMFKSIKGQKISQQDESGIGNKERLYARNDN